MASGSVTPPTGEPQGSDPTGAMDRTPGAGDVGEPPRGDQRYGPLLVLRTHKDDGRALILYSRDERGSG